MKKETVQETNRRFKNYVKIDPSGCWLWTGALCKGYPLFYLSKKQRAVRAHRYLWEVLNGPIPKNYELHHRCRNKNCVRPAHLRLLKHKAHMIIHAKKGIWSGAKNSQAKRSEKDILTIKCLNEFFHLPAKTISHVMGIPKRSIFSILSGECWESVQLPDDLK
jgi:HNH endonuclease